MLWSRKRRAIKLKQQQASKQQWLRVKNKIKQQDNHEYKSLFKELTQKHMV